MQSPSRRCFGGFLAIAITWITLTGITLQITKSSTKQENAENSEWIASSKSWVNRQLCRWCGLCGLPHLNRDGWAWDTVHADIRLPPLPDTRNWWSAGTEDPLAWTDEEKAAREIPQYVLDYAPYVHLFSGEQFWPGDIAEHLIHTPPHINYTKIWDLDDERNLTNLHELNEYDGGHYGRFMYLQSSDNVEERPRPKWLGGEDNIPNAPERGALKDGADVAQQQPSDNGPLFRGATTEDRIDYLPAFEPSADGRCGGRTGFTCKGSEFGQCCSIYGWCGEGEDFCGDSCDGVAGKCNDPFAPDPSTHDELRKRALEYGGRKHRPGLAGRSSAPAILIVVPKENGIVDAFWFFFYSFNLGQKVFNVRFGNHVGDWEHTLIRFKDGEPESAFLSEHNFGGAYAWHALEKYLPDPHDPGRMLGTWSNATAAAAAKRPVVYSAVGTHAMYAKPGSHPYILPWGLLHDQTDRGPLWDPSLNLHSYTWNPVNQKFLASTRNPDAPTGWFHYAGHWGDKFYPLSDPRQYRIVGQYHYVNGPVGPRFKRLGRERVCQGKGRKCTVRQWATNARATRFQPEEYAEEGGLPGGNSTDEVDY